MKHGTVLLADQHLTMLQGVRSLLEGCFEAVVMVADEASLFQAVQGLQPACAVVDLSFPCSCCDEASNIVSVLHQRTPHLKLIALSIHDERTVAERVLELGALAFVVKGSAVTDLLPAIEAVMNGKTYVSASVLSPASTSVSKGAL